MDTPCFDRLETAGCFDWPETAGEPDDAWFGYLLARGWRVDPVPQVALVGDRRYRRYLGRRSPQPA